MSDFFETSIKNFSGLSTETKPTIAAGNNVPNGSRWREIDTDKLYHFNLSDDTWYEVYEKIKITDGTNDAAISLDGQIHVVMEGKVDNNNSTVTPLLANDVFTGSATDILPYSGIGLLVGSDVEGSLTVQFGPDGIDWHDGETYVISAGAEKFFTPPVQSAYYRVVYINGGSNQTTFFVHSVLKKSPFKWSSHNIDSPIVDQDDAELVKAVITGKRNDGVYDNVSLTNGANMKVSLEELESGISSNSNSQLNVTIFDTTGVPAGVDDMTETLKVIDHAHHEIHEGDSFRVQHYHDAIPATGTGGELIIAFFVPDQTRLPHIIFDFIHEGDMTFSIYEGVTFNANAGSDVSPVNDNRNSSNTSILQGKATGSLVSGYVTVGEESADNIYSGGTAIFLQRNFGTKNAGTQSGQRNEFILKTNTNYAFSLLNNEALAQGGQILLDWYEHIPKN